MIRLFLLILLCLIPTSAWACTPKEGYRTPTNFELVQKAQLIVLARIKSGPDDLTGKRPEIEIEPVRVLKGKLPGEPLHLMGSLKWNERAIPSMPTTLATAHFSTGMGACVRVYFPKGGLVVAMFGPTPADMKAEFADSMMPLFEPFARAAEDVENAEGVWVKAVTAYVALQAATDEGHLRDAVEHKRADYLAQTGDNAAQAMAADLASYLDVTSGATDRMADTIQWRFFDLPDDTGAIIGSRTFKGRILRCRTGSSALELYWPQEEGTAKALKLGNVSFPITPAKLVLSPDMKSSSGTIAVDERLLSALQAATGKAGVEMEDGTIEAPPLDVLQKFGPRCAALVKGTSEG